MHQQEEEETEISPKLMVQVKAANGGVGSREMVPQPQANQNSTQDVSTTNQRTPLGDESLYAFVDGGVITIPLFSANFKLKFLERGCDYVQVSK